MNTFIKALVKSGIHSDNPEIVTLTWQIAFGALIFIAVVWLILTLAGHSSAKKTSGKTSGKLLGDRHGHELYGRKPGRKTGSKLLPTETNAQKTAGGQSRTRAGARRIANQLKTKQKSP